MLTGKTATAIGTGRYHTCALRNDSKVVCLGYNGYGQLGRVGPSTTGETAASMGANLVAVDIGAGIFLFLFILLIR